MSADCSVGANPLARLNKQAQQDRSLQHGGSFQSTSNAPQSFKSRENIVSDANKFKMDSFMGRETHIRLGQTSPSGVPSPLEQQRGRGSWSHQFAASPDTVSSGSLGNSNWAHELHSSSPRTSHTIQNSNVISAERVQGFQPRMVSNYRPSMSSALPTMVLHQNSGIHSGMQHETQNLQHAMSPEVWEEQFKELEREVSENLKLGDDVDQAETSETLSKEQDIIVDDTYQAEFQEVWDNLHEEATENNVDSTWEKDYARYVSGKPALVAEYKFDPDNQYLKNPNSYEIGCILMENGAKLSEAALAFEAAVQEEPNHVDAWLKLGLVQTQNEKELSGISALEECLKIDPGNLEGMMTLAISYINEGYDVSAFSMLSKWLETKYPQLVDNHVDSETADRYNLNQAVTQQFLHVVNKLPEIDAELQLGLGILFYANDDYDKTIDCFRAALTVRPDDELMWNRLGASLANSNRSEEAIQAYHKALQLKPTFVRARCNLAVSSMNMGCYKEAADHLLTALSMHEVEGVSLSDSVASTTILETLKRAFIAMGRRDLLEQVKPNMDLTPFRGEFNF
ncbi:LAFE_0H04632g1_1 [Lachancea fermentati]|uniref:LAFE_0H04632g1_1 n=1 Tax=Lachancea fermentati TaxID=4955 RepID=A0A1G4MJJ9_LACFM|nr:LAFE_0H04632g1_1 [Lachancea fermentati]